MNKRFGPVSMLAAISLMFTGFVANAAAPSNANIAVGTSTTGGVGNLKIDVVTSSASVTFSYKVGGVSRTEMSSSAVAGNIFNVGGPIIIRVSGSVAESVHARPGASQAADAITDTGITAVSSTNAGNFSAMPLTLPQNTLGGSSGLVVACFPMSYYATTPTATPIWHCSQSFEWPAAASGGGSTFIAATTETVVTHNNPSVAGTGAILEITPATWVGRSPSISFSWQYKTSCTSGNQFYMFSLSSGGSVVTTQTFTVPATIYVDADNQFPFSYTTAISTYGVALIGTTNWSSGSEYGGSGGRSFGVGSGFCGSSTPRGTLPASSAPKYAGPEFSSFGAPVLAGDKLVSQGKRLDGITSMKINGAAATYKVNSASELEIDVPKELAPGKYDIEITSTHGKLTHLQAFTVKAVVPTKTLEFKGDGRTFGYEELLELTKLAKQIGAEYTSVKCIVNAADAEVAQRLVARGCDYVGAIRLRGKEISTEPKSSYKGDGFWFKIVANG